MYPSLKPKSLIRPSELFLPYLADVPGESKQRKKLEKEVQCDTHDEDPNIRELKHFLTFKCSCSFVNDAFSQIFNIYSFL